MKMLSPLQLFTSMFFRVSYSFLVFFLTTNNIWVFNIKPYFWYFLSFVFLFISLIQLLYLTFIPLLRFKYFFTVMNPILWISFSVMPQSWNRLYNGIDSIGFLWPSFFLGVFLLSRTISVIANCFDLRMKEKKF
jgi:hypothetical protein